MGKVVEFYYDIACPFAYIASLRIEEIAARNQATIICTIYFIDSFVFVLIRIQ